MAMQTANVGRALRDSQLALFQLRDAEFLETCRALAIEVIKRKGTVSINDIRERLTIPAGTNPSVMGAIFRTKQFKVVWFTEANHPQAHARTVRVYALKGGE